MNTAIYLRKSRAEEISDTAEETLARHKETLMSIAKAKKLTVSDIYEEVITGEYLFTRVQMLKLLEAVRQKKYDSVLVMDLDRLGRGSGTEQDIILNAFKESKTLIITPRKTYDLNNDIDEEYSEFETFMARRELKTIKRRLARGKAAAVREGCYLSNPPFGYDRAYVNKKATLSVNKAEAEFVKLMFDMYVNQGLGCQTIAYRLNELKVKPHRTDTWGRTSVQRIIRNPIYIGKVVWNRKKIVRKTEKSKQKVTQKPKEEWIVSEGLHDPIIDTATFEAAQRIYEGRYHPPSYTGSIVNPFAGLIICRKCCKSMVYRSYAKNSEKPYILCTTKGCTKATMFEYVEKSILYELQRKLDSLNLEIKGFAKKGSGFENYDKALETAQKELFRLQNQKSNLHDLLEQGVYTTDVFTERSNNINIRITALEKDIKNLEKKKEKSIDALIKVRDKTEKFIKVYDSLSVQEKNNALKEFIEQINYYKEKNWDKKRADIDIIYKEF